MATDNVEFVGRLDGEEMVSFYRGARGLVLPSTNYEMCPLVIGEAMSQGVPVIASDIGGIPELVNDGVTGLLFEPGHSGRLAEKIRQIDESPTLCRQFGEAGWETARNEFGEPKYLEELIGIYEQAIDPSKTKSPSVPYITDASDSISAMEVTT